MRNKCETTLGVDRLGRHVRKAGLETEIAQAELTQARAALGALVIAHDDAIHFRNHLRVMTAHDLWKREVKGQ